MNSKERVMNRLQGKTVDRSPNCSLIMSFAKTTYVYMSGNWYK